jgi:uncharacterized protein (TIGR00661 family)
MKLLFCVQGEGRGHLTQTMAVKQTVEAHGHQVVGVMVGLSSKRSLPEYFESAMRVPLVVLPTVEFVYTQNRSVNLPGTLSSALWHARRHSDSLRKINVMVREYKPDIIINFFEPLAALYAASRRRRPPVLVIAHQFMLEHPDYVRAPGLRVQQAGLKWFVQLVGLASTKLALSLYEAPDLPKKSLFVCPPILRKQLFDLQPDPDGKFALIYLLNHGYADQIIRWHEAHPELELHCFYDRPGAPPEQRHDATLTFHRLDGNKFLKMMAACRCVVSTAGFESVGEAAYLGKPMFLVPVQNHIEQQLNALDAVRLGLGITDNSFQLDRLAELPARLPTTGFRAWVQRAESILMRTIERVAETHP